MKRTHVKKQIKSKELLYRQRDCDVLQVSIIWTGAIQPALKNKFPSFIPRKEASTGWLKTN